MVDRVHILNGDELDEDLLAEALGRTGISDYVERGLIPSASDVDFGNAVVDIPAGKAFLIDNGRDVMLLPDARAGVQLATDGVNHVFIYYDLGQPEDERIDYHVSSDGAPPAYPYLKIAEIDMGASEVRPQNDTAPIYRRDAETYKGNDIDPDGDGVVSAADEAFLVQGGNVSGSVALADEASLVQGGNVNGAVAEADHAANADVAAEAGTAAEIDGTAAGKGGVAEVVTDTDYRRNTLDNLGGLNLRIPTDELSNWGMDVYGQYLPNQEVEAIRFVPVRSGGANQPNELQYRFRDNVWNFRATLENNYNEVLDRADESRLDVNSATTADSATTAGSADVATSVAKAEKVRMLINSPNFHTPLIELDPGETINFGPFATRGNDLELWTWGVMAEGGGTANSARLRLRDTGGNQYNATNAANESGNPDTLSPIANYSINTNRFVFQLRNGTGSPRKMSATAGYYLG